MTEPVIPSADPYDILKAHRRTARRLMQAVAVVCALAAAGIGADQFYTGGLQAFLERPPGVGATPPDPQADSTARPAPSPRVALAPPARGETAPGRGASPTPPR
jgi:hypothetical protein